MAYIPLPAVDFDHVEALGSRVPRGDWLIKVWPTCGEATLTFQKEKSDYVDYLAPFDPMDRDQYRHDFVGVEVEDNATRAVRRARAEVRRYNRHNDLVQMVTLTFRGDVPVFESLSDTLRKFWQRFEYATGEKRGAYLWVPEWGKVTGRLHIHMAVNWWDRLNCVEVCPKCDRFGVLDKFPRSLAQGFFCVGCTWGLGFVGRPMTKGGDLESNDDGRGLSKYLSKYLAKDLGGGFRLGGQRYRVAQGYAPESLTLRSSGPVSGIYEALGAMSDRFALDGEMPTMFVPSDNHEWAGPPVVVLDWKSQSALERGSEKCG